MEQTKGYTSPTVEIISFGQEDIVTASVQAEEGWTNGWY